MAVNETIVTGRKLRKLINEANKLWQRISIWTKASDVEFDDGQTAETKMGAIKGITADLNTTETGYAADITALAKLNSDINTEISNMRYPMPTTTVITNGSLTGGRTFTWTATEDCYVTASLWTNNGGVSYASLNGAMMIGINENGATMQGWVYGSFFARRGSSISIHGDGTNVSTYRIYKVQ